MSGHALQVSVVIPTFYRPDLLQRCLEAVTNQDLAPDTYEVIVADDGADEATRRLVHELDHECGPRISYVRVEGSHGPAAARNQGWRAAQAPLIAFTDDDCIPTRGWLSAGVAMAREGADCARGRIAVPMPAQPTDYELDASHLGTAEFATANCFVCRAALEEIGGFDERFTAAWREDSDLLFSLTEHGCTVAAAPDALVVHPIRPAPWGVSLKQQRKSAFNALLYKKHPRLYRERIQPAPPWRYYRIVGALAALTFGLGTRHRRLAAGSTLGWLAMTGAFAGARLRHTTWKPAHVAEMLVTSALIPPLSIYWRLRGALKYRVAFL